MLHDSHPTECHNKSAAHCPSCHCKIALSAHTFGQPHKDCQEFKDILPWNISQMITKTIPISTRIRHKARDETGYPVLSLLESQWKLRQEHDQNFPMKGKPL